MPSITATAVQSALLRAVANVVAQVAADGGSKNSFATLDLQRVLEFAIFGFISAHISYVWHQFLEETFPTRQVANAPNKKTDEASPKGQGSINWRNFIAKLLVDQLFGLPFMNVTFLLCTNAARVNSVSSLLDLIGQRVAALVLAGWKIWPAVGVFNFLLVPPGSRVVFLNTIGFGWSIFLSLSTKA